MTKTHYHTVDVKYILHRCSHQQAKNSLFLVDIWTVQKGNVLCYQTGTQEANAPLVPEFLLKEQCQSSGWQQQYEKLINSEQNQTKIKG